MGDKICELRRAFTVTVLGKRGLTAIMDKNKYVVWVARVGHRLIGSAIIGTFEANKLLETAFLQAGNRRGRRIWGLSDACRWQGERSE